MNRHRCSMSSYVDGPWHCGSGACDGGPDCEANQRNAFEAEWLERALGSWETAWARAYGLALPTLRDAKQAYDRAYR